MTRKAEAIDIVDRYLRAGGSVCPHARRATIHYAIDNEALGPMLTAIGVSEAGVVIGSRDLDGFAATKRWAQDTVLSMFAAAASLAYPSLSHRHVKDLVRTQAEPVLRNDLDARRLYIPVRNQPVLPVCMAPVYPATHPRYSPRPIIVLTFVGTSRASRSRPFARPWSESTSPWRPITRPHVRGVIASTSVTQE